MSALRGGISSKQFTATLDHSFARASSLHVLRKLRDRDRVLHWDELCACRGIEISLAGVQAGGDGLQGGLKFGVRFELGRVVAESGDDGLDHVGLEVLLRGDRASELS